jgi:hypothetical protein
MTLNDPVVAVEDDVVPEFSYEAQRCPARPTKLRPRPKRRALEQVVLPPPFAADARNPAYLTLPAFVQNHRLHVLATNPLARALYSEMFDDPACGANTARFVFSSPAAPGFYAAWDSVAAVVVGQLRVEAGHNPQDSELTDLVGELSTRSGLFSELWAANDVHVWSQGTQDFRHPVAGDLELNYESMELLGDSGPTMRS